MNNFTNPYNFVPLEGTCSRTGLLRGKKEACRTGYFECSMELMTPLFIPNTSCQQALCNMEDRENGYIGYEFNSYEDLSGDVKRGKDGYTFPPKEPVISGSEIRGAVRSVYEAAFGGCMSTVDLDRVLGRRHPKFKKPGILRKNKEGEYEIIPCKRAMLNVEGPVGNSDCETFGRLMTRKEYDSLKEGQEIWIKLAKKGYIKNGRTLNVKVIKDYIIPDHSVKQNLPDAYKKGWLHKGEPFSKKHHESVFYGRDEKSIKKVFKKDVELLQMVINQYQKPKKRSENRQEPYPEFRLESDEVLIYYCDEDGMPFYLSPACIGKELYRKTLRTILEANGGFQPCSGREGLCPACMIFGMVAQKEGEKDSVGTRVRFTDATLKNSNNTTHAKACYLDPMVLPESGEPRPGAVEFYTVPPYMKNQKRNINTEGYWTYDYICVKPGEKSIRKILPDNLPVLRGRKFYWHNNNWRKYKGDNKLDHIMKQRIRPLKASDCSKRENVFRFRVYFDKLNREQLGRLRWSLDFADSRCAHKVGRGKPLGFGSVKIHIEDMMVQTINPESGQIQMRFEDYADLGKEIEEDGEAIKTLKLMSNFEDFPVDVSYPEVEGKEGESFRWFTNNRTKGMQPEFIKILPKAMEEWGENKNRSKKLDRTKRGYKKE